MERGEVDRHAAVEGARISSDFSTAQIYNLARERGVGRINQDNESRKRVVESISKDEFLRRVNANNEKLVIAFDNVYDIAQLGDIHPGGRKVSALRK